MANAEPRQPRSRAGLLLLAGATVLAASVFAAILERRIQVDIPLHAREALRLGRGQALQPHFLYHVALLCVSGFQLRLKVLFGASVVVLALAVLGKMLLSIRIARRQLGHLLPRSPRSELLLAAGAVSLAFVHNLPVSTSREVQLAIGEIPPNVWHNPTTIFLMPFALALFHCGLRLLERPDAPLLKRLAWLSALNVLAKPSYFFAFAPSFGILALLRFGVTPRLFRAAAALAAGGVLVAAQAALLARGSGEPGPGVAVSFLFLWHQYSANLPASFLASMAFPLAFVACDPRAVVRSRIARFAWVGWAVGMVPFLFLVETGERMQHWNFRWQATVCTYLLFLVTLLELARGVASRGALRGRDRALLALYSAHVASGVWYLQRLVFHGLWR